MKKLYLILMLVVLFSCNEKEKEKNLSYFEFIRKYSLHEATYTKYDSLGGIISEVTVNAKDTDEIFDSVAYKYDEKHRLIAKEFYSKLVSYPEDKYTRAYKKRE